MILAALAFAAAATPRTPSKIDRLAISYVVKEMNGPNTRVQSIVTLDNHAPHSFKLGSMARIHEGF